MEPFDTDGSPQGGSHSGGATLASLVQSLQQGLADVGESDRYRALAEVFANWADHSRAADNGRVAGDQIKALARKVQDLEKSRADLDDLLRTTRADLAARDKQLDAEQGRARELQTTVESQRNRLESTQTELSGLEQELVRRNTELHEAQSRGEQLLLKLQRAQLESGNREQVEALEQARAQAAAQMEALRAEMEQLRQEKNAEIDRLRGELTAAGAGPSKGADALLAVLWERLASAQPPLSRGGIQPTHQAAERLVDAFIELAAFVAKFDQDMRMFLGKYTKHNSLVGKPWKAYAEREDFHQVIQQTVEPAGNRNVGVLKMKLRVCLKWAFAAMVSSDSAIESLAAELQSHLMGPAGAGSDPRCTVRDYLKNNGPDLFLEHMLKLRSEKLAEVYGLGV
ncbi:MAG: hypothetical protein AMXMBFR13_21030 [Phycisphaerae bacterium]